MEIKTIEEVSSEKKRLAASLDILDASMWLGQPEGFPNASAMSFPVLKEAANRHFITGGLVSHWSGKTASAQDGNRFLTEEFDSGKNNFYPIWTGLPLFPEEPGPLPGLSDMPSKVKAVRVFPKTNKFMMSGFVLGSLCKFLIGRSMPLMVWHTELEWKELYDLAGDFPDLNIIVETQIRKILYHMRNLMPLMRERKNVLLEISNFAGGGFLDYAVGQFGAERFIFGSFMPVADPFVPVGMLLDASCGENQKKMIAGDNLKRIIDGVKS